jgi:hypothetical protein
LKKILPLFLALFIFTSTFFMQVEKASANPLVGAMAVGTGAGYAAVGVYVLGGLLVAAGAAAVGSQYSDQIKQSSVNVWNKFDDTSRGLWKTAISASIEAGKTSVSMTKELYDSLVSASGALSAEVKDLVKGYEASKTVENDAAYHSRQIYMTGVTFNIGTYSSTKWYFDITGSSFQNINLRAANGLGYFAIALTPENQTALNAINSYGSMVAFILKYWGQTVTPVLATSAAPPIDYYNDSVDTAIQGLSGAKEINIPLDQFLAKNATGENLTYDETTNTMTNTDGSTYTGEVTWDYPVAGVSSPTAVSNPAVPISSVVTGDTSFVTDTPPPPPPPPPEPGRLNWSKLTTALSGLIKVFPFSIPWDFYHFFSQFDVSPKTPVYHIQADRQLSIGGKTIPFNMDWEIDFSIFDVVAKVVRWGTIICFDIYMITALRKYTPD